MTETADVVIIGSGIVGSSVAYHLAQQGCTNVLVIEREAHQGKGSTGKSMGGVRAQFSTPVNIQMSKYSIDFFSKFDEVVGHPADYRAHGYLFCATNEKHLAYLKANKERQNALGVMNVEWVTPDDIVKLVLALRRLHSTWGPKKLHEALKRKQPNVHIPAPSTIASVRAMGIPLASGHPPA